MPLVYGFRERPSDEFILQEYNAGAELYSELTVRSDINDHHNINVGLPSIVGSYLWLSNDEFSKINKRVQTINIAEVMYIYDHNLDVIFVLPPPRENGSVKYIAKTTPINDAMKSRTQSRKEAIGSGERGVISGESDGSYNIPGRLGIATCAFIAYLLFDSQETRLQHNSH